MRLPPLPALAALAALAAPMAAPAQDLRLSSGQTVYVPVYSHILHGNLDSKQKPQELLLSSMLSIRNTDPTGTLTVLSARYYDTSGKLVRDLLPGPKALGPLASTDFFIEHKDETGGTGANFLVEWKADKAVVEPIIENVSAYFFGPHSLAFTSPGRPLPRPDGK